MTTTQEWARASASYSRAGQTIYGWATVDWPRTSHLLRGERGLVDELAAVRERAVVAYRQGRALFAEALVMRQRNELAHAVSYANRAADLMRRTARETLREEQRILQAAQRAGIVLDVAQSRYGDAMRRVSNEARGAASNVANAASSAWSSLSGLAIFAGLLVLASATGGRRR